MNIQEIKRTNSETKIGQLIELLAQEEEVVGFEHLAIFVAGSYARNEASEFSDIDLFFVFDGQLKDLEEPNTKSLRLFAKIIEIADKMDFPKFSNDGQYLTILEKPNILRELGGPNDDHQNFFTTRMLMMLESKCVFGEATHEAILKDILSAYFVDYPDHPKDFMPTFLVNDILRFWKTLCLNYENKRNQPAEDPKKRIKQKIKNLKLKFSRMMTCYASICYIIYLKAPIGTEDIVTMSTMPPLERMRTVVSGDEGLEAAFQQVEDEYRWFLDLTNVSEAELNKKFEDKALRTEAFERADKFGQRVYEITRKVAEANNYLRFLLV